MLSQTQANSPTTVRIVLSSYTMNALGRSVTVAQLVLIGCTFEGEPVGESKSYIVNGSPTTEYPGTAVLADSYGGFCTGTLIAPRLVLTAAHCLFDQSNRQYGPTEVRVGFGADESSAQYVQSTQLRVHPSYSNSSSGEATPDDVAVVMLGQDAPVAPVPLATMAPGIGQQVTLVGFGNSNGRAQSGFGTKRMVGVTIARVEAKMWEYDAQGGRGSCTGDSGGPAYLETPTGPALIGVTSSGDEFCEYVGAYSRIDAYMDFIGPVDTPTPSPADVGVSGTVTDALSGAPVVGATVAVTSLGVSGQSDASGAFMIGLPAGMHVLQVSASGYAPAMVSCTAVAGASCPVMLQTLGAGPVVPTPPGGSATVQGMVYQVGSNAPVPLASALIQELAMPLALDPNTGVFLVEVPAGSYTVSATDGTRQGSATCQALNGQMAWCPVGLQSAIGPVAPPPTPPSADVGVVDGGCSASGGASGGLWLLVLLSTLRRKKRYRAWRRSGGHEVSGAQHERSWFERSCCSILR